MTLLTDSHTPLVVDVVRGDRARRPRRDDDAAAGLRALLDDHVYRLWGPVRHPSVVVSSATIRHAGPMREITDSTLSRARGVAVSLLFRLLVARVHVDDPFDTALDAWRGVRPNDELLERVEHLDADQSARLRADVVAHYDTLARCLGPVPSTWSPRTSQRARLSLGGGALQLHDVIDLVVGSVHTEDASVALVDVTTSPLGSGAERAMRFHALTQTLRTSVVPLRTSVFSSATGELWSRAVDVDLLIRAVDDVVAVLVSAREGL